MSSHSKAIQPEEILSKRLWWFLSFVFFLQKFIFLALQIYVTGREVADDGWVKYKIQVESVFKKVKLYQRERNYLFICFVLAHSTFI